MEEIRKSENGFNLSEQCLDDIQSLSQELDSRSFVNVETIKSLLANIFPSIFQSMRIYCNEITTLELEFEKLQDRHAKSLRDLNIDYQIELEKSDQVIDSANEKINYLEKENEKLKNSANEKTNYLEKENQKLKKEIFTLKQSKIVSTSICVQPNGNVVRYDKDIQTEINLDPENWNMIKYDQDLNKADNSSQTTESDDELSFLQNDPEGHSYCSQNDKQDGRSEQTDEINEESESDLPIELYFQQENDEAEQSIQSVEELGEIEVDKNRKFQLKGFLISIGYYYLFLFLYTLWGMSVNEENFVNKHCYTVSLLANYFSELMSSKKLHKRYNNFQLLLGVYTMFFLFYQLIEFTFVTRNSK